MGVKQLWTLLGPVGRPVLLETMEGKTMAIDSSIWIYQFQATMRDKDGRALVNAHVLGFLRRICKLLFYGIKPVFVFDGGAPVLKRTTLIERKRKKAGAADSHIKVAEKLLAAQLRREALAHVQKKKPQKTAPSAPESRPVINEDTVYLEDLERNTVPNTTPKKDKGKQRAPSDSSPDSAKKKAKFHDHDPYRLPDVDPSSITQPTSSLAPDPRLATEDELRTFIESMRPEDFNVGSPAFRDLPTEVQYEIIGDLRLKSRQTSHKRLQVMLRSAPTPLDFSKAQIRNLQQRNSLTQQLLETTDSIGKAHVTIPVRIASERNKEYVLVKNEGAEGGWVLGIRDDGTQAKPIVIDGAGEVEEGSENEGESEMEMEEVKIPAVVAPDSDLREYHGRMALASISKRDAPKQPLPRPPRASDSKIPNKQPLFTEEFEEGGDLDAAIQQSLELQEDEEDEALQQAISASIAETAMTQSKTPSSAEAQPFTNEDSESDDLYMDTPSRLDTALSFANTSPSKRTLVSTVNARSNASVFGRPSVLLSEKPSASAVGSGEKSSQESENDTKEDMLPVKSTTAAAAILGSARSDEMEEIMSVKPSAVIEHGFDGVCGGVPAPRTMSFQPEIPLQKASPDEIVRDESSSPSRFIPSRAVSQLSAVDTPKQVSAEEVPEDEDVFSDWERSSSPLTGQPTGDAEPSRSLRHEAEAWDAAQEMDVVAEEGDFTEFVSQMKGQDLDAARKEIDEEIRDLHKQKKVAMRDSEDITHQMISQIMLMLRLFGIPYITAPMEAEAQCATLVSLDLVDGVITDDSDVFLFGGLRVYKNMFNQSKTIESFLLSDLARELGLERDKLIRLAYLLGSDYVEGLPGVGPVVAMELLKEFPGDDGLHKFKEWWKKVQSGKDTSEDTGTKFRRRFRAQKKKFKDLYLPEDWPSAAVRDAYYYPTVDESEEPFKWGLPDLDALRDFFREELGWHQGKVDDLLLPIIRKMGQRAQAAASNRQGTLDGFLNAKLGSGTFAPRKRQAYSSKRLQQVVADFRAEQTKARNGAYESQVDDSESDIEDRPPKKKMKGKEQASRSSKKKELAKRKSRGSTQRGTSKKHAVTSRSSPASEREEAAMEEALDTSPPALAAKLRPRPKPLCKDVQAAGEDGEPEGSEDSDEEFVIKRRRPARKSL